MVLAYTVIGSMLAPVVYWDRVVAILMIYFLGLGIAAHALDAIGAPAGSKPWSNTFSKRMLWAVAITALVMAYGIGTYYIVTVAPWLGLIAALEGFFLFAYNLEGWNGRFHTDSWFVFSWGILPVWAGFVIQTNRLSFPALFLGVAMGLVSLVEINASRPYKALKKSGEESPHIVQYETILKSVSGSVILLAIGMMLWRR
jgi:hypothetical protein